MSHPGGCICTGLGPLFPGETDLDQLGRVTSALGSIDVLDWPEATALPDFGKVSSRSPLCKRLSTSIWPVHQNDHAVCPLQVSFAESPAMSIADILPDASSMVLDLLRRFLQWNPGAVSKSHAMCFEAVAVAEHLFVTLSAS